MNEKYYLDDEALQLFRDATLEVKRIPQDTVAPVITKIVHKAAHKELRSYVNNDQENPYYYFSDQYQPQLALTGPLYYIRPDVTHNEVKKLRHGHYQPGIFLDLHGLTKIQAKQALSNLLQLCQSKRIQCACLIHGHGKAILKQHLPLWLAQHPDVLLLHEAPKQWGGSAALLVRLATAKYRR